MKKLLLVLVLVSLSICAFGTITNVPGRWFMSDGDTGGSQDGTPHYLTEDHSTSGVLVSNQSSLTDADTDHILKYSGGGVGDFDDNKWTAQDVYEFFNTVSDFVTETNPNTSDTFVYNGSTIVPRNWGEMGLNPANVVTVAGSGADYTTIQGAVDSISDAASTNTYVVRVYPGIYDEKITGKDHVSIVGTDRKTCKIISNQTWDEVNAHTGYVVKITNGELRNFYIENERSSYPSVAVYMSGDGLVKNCDLIGHAQDVIILDDGRVSNCYINTDSVSSTTDAVSIRQGTPEIFDCLIDVAGGCGFWFGGGNSTTKVYNTTVVTGGSYPGIRSQDSGLTISIYFYCCEFYNNNGAAPLFQNSDGSNTTVYYSQCVSSAYGNTNVTYTEMETLSLDVSDDATIGDELTVTGDATLNNAVTFGLGQNDFTINACDLIGNNYRKRYNGDTGKTEWSVDGGSPSWDVNLYPSSGNLVTDDLLIADSFRAGTANNPATGGINASGDFNTSGTVLADTGFKVGDTTVIDSSRYGYLAQLGIVETDMDYPLHVDGRATFDMQGNSQYVYIRDAAEGNLGIIGQDSSGDGEFYLYNSAHAAKVALRTDANTGYIYGSFTVGDGSDTLTVNDRLLLTPVASVTGASGAMYYDSDDNHFYGYTGAAFIQLDNPCVDLFIEETHEADGKTTIVLRQLGTLWDKASDKNEKVCIPFKLPLTDRVSLQVRATEEGEIAIIDKYQFYYKQDDKIEKLDPILVEGETPCPYGEYIRYIYDIPGGITLFGFAADGRMDNEFFSDFLKL